MPLVTSSGSNFDAPFSFTSTVPVLAGVTTIVWFGTGVGGAGWGGRGRGAGLRGCVTVTVNGRRVSV